MEKNKPIGILEIATQINFTVLLRTRKSGHYGRKKTNNSIYLADRFLSRTLLK